MSAPIVKHYTFEASNPNSITRIEEKLEARLLQIKSTDRILAATVDELAEAHEGNGDTKLVVYDSEDFDVLFSKTWTIQKLRRGKQRWIRKDIPDIPGLYGAEIVVKAAPPDLIALQQYISEQELVLREAREVSTAILHAGTVPGAQANMKNFISEVNQLAKDHYQLKGSLSMSSEPVNWGDGDKTMGYIGIGTFIGPVETVLKFRKALLNAGYAMAEPIKKNRVSFE